MFISDSNRFKKNKSYQEPFQLNETNKTDSNLTFFITSNVKKPQNNAIEQSEPDLEKGFTNLGAYFNSIDNT